jgi:hypothetical protein
MPPMPPSAIAAHAASMRKADRAASSDSIAMWFVAESALRIQAIVCDASRPPGNIPGTGGSRSIPLKA